MISSDPCPLMDLKYCDFSLIQYAISGGNTPSWLAFNDASIIISPNLCNNYNTRLQCKSRGCTVNITQFIENSSNFLAIDKDHRHAETILISMLLLRSSGNDILKRCLYWSSSFSMIASSTSTLSGNLPC
jgi:hypothetical protein